MANRTQIICMHEGVKGRSIDPVFINRLIRSLKPSWIRPFKGSNLLRLEPGRSRTELIKKMPDELKKCLSVAGTTLMVWADLDDDMPDGDTLKEVFWKSAQAAGIIRQEFDTVVFIFAKDRLENWIQYLTEGTTDESVEGPRVKHDRMVADAAKTLAKRCLQSQTEPPLPPSLEWSCKNWRQLVKLMKTS